MKVPDSVGDASPSRLRKGKGPGEFPKNSRNKPLNRSAAVSRRGRLGGTSRSFLVCQAGISSSCAGTTSPSPIASRSLSLGAPASRRQTAIAENYKHPPARSFMVLSSGLSRSGPRWGYSSQGASTSNHKPLSTSLLPQLAEADAPWTSLHSSFVIWSRGTAYPALNLIRGNHPIPGRTIFWRKCAGSELYELNC